ncbi:MAG: hypothetical protein ACHRXM_18945 [Isosphaerales bacterium]
MARWGVTADKTQYFLSSIGTVRPDNDETPATAQATGAQRNSILIDGIDPS